MSFGMFIAGNPCSFYLTDEECKYGKTLSSAETQAGFYLTDEECKLVSQEKNLWKRFSFYLTDEECKFFLLNHLRVLPPKVFI